MDDRLERDRESDGEHDLDAETAAAMLRLVALHDISHHGVTLVYPGGPCRSMADVEHFEATHTARLDGAGVVEWLDRTDLPFEPGSFEARHRSAEPVRGCKGTRGRAR